MTGKPGMNIRVPARRQERSPRAVYRDISEAWVCLEELYQELGRALSERRREQQMSQTTAAHAAGLSRDQVCLFELGKRWRHDPPGIEQLVLFFDEH